MQRLEVSGAVRPIYGSLGVKRLIKFRYPQHISTDPPLPPVSKFTQIRTKGAILIQADNRRTTDISTLTGAFRNDANAPKIKRFY